ncbi:retropepsin-like aspartic protease family protein [Sphingomonas sp. PB1R3]|uniref:retropepsin-like aspartic protease family protein n=1 Tax=Sphingomonas flavida TaxID=3096154 RepID=UPI002FC7A00F
MTSDRAMDVVYFGLILIFALSALLVRRVPIGQTLRMALIWIAIFGVAFVVIAQRDRVQGLWSNQTGSQGTLRIPMGADGHYWVKARINGIERPMLIDTGATTTALSVATARAAGLNLDESPFGSVIETANGRVTADHATIHRFVMGPILLTDVGADVSPAFGDQDIIGMNVLSRLNGWRVEGNMLVLNP